MDPIQTLRNRNRFKDLSLGVAPNFPELEPVTREIPMDTTAPKIIGPSFNDILQSTIKRMPSPEDYKPSTLRKIGAGIAGVGAGLQHGAKAGMEANQAVQDAPFRKEQENWVQDYKRDKGLNDLDISEQERINKEDERQFEHGIKNKSANIQQGTLDVHKEHEAKIPTFDQSADLKREEWHKQLEIATANNDEQLLRVLLTQQGLDKRQQDKIVADDNRSKGTNDSRERTAAIRAAATKYAADKRAGKGTKLSPSQQSSAANETLNRLYRDPETQPYIKLRTNDKGEQIPSSIMTVQELQAKGLSPQKAQQMYEHLKKLHDVHYEDILDTAGVDEDEDDWEKVD